MSVSESREIERKYAVPSDAVVPELTDVEQVARVRTLKPADLDAQYYDTDDLALLADRITLRRRTGGRDAGWHLKLPGDGFRRELHAPLGEDDVLPDDLTVRLHASLRGRPVERVVRLQTRRVVHELLDADGRVLAEVCDDRVTSTPSVSGAHAQRWREWEVELVDGAADLLDAVEQRLHQSGARPDAGPAKLAKALEDVLPTRVEAPWPSEPTVADVARRYLARESARLKDHDCGVRLHEHDAIHQMRVAARRLRSVLSSYRDLLPGDLSATLRTELKALADSLGQARDSEVMLARLIRLLDEQPDDAVLGPVRERITTTLQQRYDEGHAAALQFMTSARYYALLDALDDLVMEVEPTASGHRRASEALIDFFDRDWKRLRRAVHHSDSLSDRDEYEESLHEVRKAAKRLRYGMESIADVLGKDARRVARSASAITEILGDHNDSVITSQVISELAGEAFNAGENAFTYGRMHSQEQSSALMSQDEYREALHRLNHYRFDRWKEI